MLAVLTVTPVLTVLVLEVLTVPVRLAVGGFRLQAEEPREAEERRLRLTVLAVRMVPVLEVLPAQTPCSFRL